MTRCIFCLNELSWTAKKCPVCNKEQFVLHGYKQFDLKKLRKKRGRLNESAVVMLNDNVFKQTVKKEEAKENALAYKISLEIIQEMKFEQRGLTSY